jgi:cell division protein ZapE
MPVAPEPWLDAEVARVAENVAVRLVVLAGPAYDRDLPLLAGGVPVDRMFSPEMLKGGYR